MSTTVRVTLTQTGPTTTESVMRDHAVLVDRPEAKGGADRGPMGGEYLLTALGGCFASNLYAIAEARGAPLSNVRVEVAGELDGNPTRYVAIHLDIHAEGAEREQLKKFVLLAERNCICANTLKNSVQLTFTLA